MGIIPKNETKSDEMVDIMAHMHQYVPIIESSEEVYVPCLDEKVKFYKARTFPIIVAGDQLTAARARGAKKVKFNSDSPTNRFEGLIPTATDWHTKQALLGVKTVVIECYLNLKYAVYVVYCFEILVRYKFHDYILVFFLCRSFGSISTLCVLLEIVAHFTSSEI